MKQFSVTISNNNSSDIFYMSCQSYQKLWLKLDRLGLKIISIVEIK